MLFIKKLYNYLFKFIQFKIFGFGVIHIFGLLLDMAIFLLFISYEFQILFSNIIAGSFGVTFAYFISAKYIFYYNSNFLIRKFGYYVIWNVFRIVLFSFIISKITMLSIFVPIFSKIIVTPISFYVDYLFMSFLMTGKIKYY